jgi:hypothetical protein
MDRKDDCLHHDSVVAWVRNLGPLECNHCQEDHKLGENHLVLTHVFALSSPPFDHIRFLNSVSLCSGP